MNIIERFEEAPFVVEEVPMMVAQRLDAMHGFDSDQKRAFYALELRRYCLNKAAEMMVNEALAEQMDAEAERAHERAKEADEANSIITSNMHYTKSLTLKAQAETSRMRVHQANLELTFMLENT